MDIKEGEVTMENTTTLGVSVHTDTFTQLDQALDYLEERLIGAVPEIIRELHREISAAFWAGSGAVRIESRTAPAAVQPQDVDEISAAEADAIAQYEQWLDSAEGREEERFAQFVDERANDEKQRYQAWLDAQAEQFTTARRDWRRRRRAALRAEFHASSRNGS
jgi:hypothetical protein